MTKKHQSGYFRSYINHRTLRTGSKSQVTNRIGLTKVIFSLDNLKRNLETIGVKFKTRISNPIPNIPLSILSELGHNKNHQNMQKYQTNILQRGSIKHREGRKSYFNTHKDLFS